MKQNIRSFIHRRGVKITVDLLMTLSLFLVMSGKPAGEAVHEWAGIAAVAFFLLHQLMNLSWYRTVFRKKQSMHRIVLTGVDLLLISFFVLTAICGMSVSTHAVPFLYGMLNTARAHRMHLCLSRWTFLFAGIHLGMHVPGILPKKWRNGTRETVLLLCSAVLSGAGLWIASRNDFWSYLLFRPPVVTARSVIPFIPAFLEQILIFIPGVFLGEQVTEFLRILKRGDREKGMLRFFSAILAAAVWIVLLLLDPFLL